MCIPETLFDIRPFVKYITLNQNVKPEIQTHLSYVNGLPKAPSCAIMTKFYYESPCHVLLVPM